MRARRASAFDRSVPDAAPRGPSRRAGRAASPRVRPVELWPGSPSTGHRSGSQLQPWYRGSVSPSRVAGSSTARERENPVQRGVGGCIGAQIRRGPGESCDRRTRGEAARPARRLGPRGAAVRYRPIKAEGLARAMVRVAARRCAVRTCTIERNPSPRLVATDFHRPVVVTARTGAPPAPRVVGDAAPHPPGSSR